MKHLVYISVQDKTLDWPSATAYNITIHVFVILLPVVKRQTFKQTDHEYPVFKHLLKLCNLISISKLENLCFTYNIFFLTSISKYIDPGTCFAACLAVGWVGVVKTWSKIYYNIRYQEKSWTLFIIQIVLKMLLPADGAFVRKVIYRYLYWKVIKISNIIKIIRWYLKGFLWCFWQDLK
jgi:hypothetical protein